MPPAPLRRLVFLVIFFYFSVVFVLDRWWTDVVLMLQVLQLTVISEADVVSFGAQSV